MSPNMSRTIERSAKPRTVKTVMRATVDFIETEYIESRTINAVVQPAQKDSLKSENIDWSLRYLTIHTVSQLQNGELIEYGGEDYKIIDNGNYQEYGYTEALAEQTKRAVKVAT